MKEEVLDKRAAALKATLELVTEQGFQGAPMSQIAQRANIGVGTIYRYFAAKDDLINALYLDIKTRTTRYVMLNYSKDLPVRKGFNILLNNAVHFYLENPAELFFVEQYENSPAITSATREEGSRVAEPAVELFIRARDQSLLKDLPLEIIGALFSGALISLVKHYLSGKDKCDESSLSRSIDAIWDMIAR
jgi:TetR/AcrR family transcriptional regulator, repressor of fatR-cypB operon